MFMCLNHQFIFNIDLSMILKNQLAFYNILILFVNFLTDFLKINLLFMSN